MGKIIISEQRLSTLINECVEEVMLEEGLIGRAWNGIKQGARNLRQGIKDAGGIGQWAATKYGEAQRGLENYRNEINKAYRTGRRAADAKAVGKSHPIEYWRRKYGDQFVDTMERIGGFNPNGKTNYPREKFIQALRAYNLSDNDINAILQMKGYNPLGATEMQQNGTETNGTQTGEQTTNPDVAQQQQQQPKAQPQASGWGNMDNAEYMDEAINKAVSKAINEVINEVGDTWRGQEMLGRLSARREKQSGDELRKAGMALDPDEEEKHRKKAANYLGRSTAAYVKARDERNKKYDSWTKPAQMMANAFHGGEAKGKRERK